MTRYTYPHVLDNGAGERLVFERRVTEGGEDRLEGENLVKPGAGPPMHVHHLQEETLTVVEGRMGYQRPGGAPHYAGPGETVSFPPGDAHRFWNAGDTDLRCRGLVRPALNLEYFLTELFESSRRHGGRPGLFDLAFLITRYRSEFAVLEVPSTVQRVFFPVVVGVGRLLGRYGRFDGAPPPARG